MHLRIDRPIVKIVKEIAEETSSTQSAVIRSLLRDGLEYRRVVAHNLEIHGI